MESEFYKILGLDRILNRLFPVYYLPLCSLKIHIRIILTASSASPMWLGFFDKGPYIFINYTVLCQRIRASWRLHVPFRIALGFYCEILLATVQSPRRRTARWLMYVRECLLTIFLALLISAGRVEDVSQGGYEITPSVLNTGNS